MIMSEKEKMLCIKCLKNGMDDLSMEKSRSHMKYLIDILEIGKEPAAEDLSWLAYYFEEKIGFFLAELSSSVNGAAGRVIRDAMNLT